MDRLSSFVLAHRRWVFAFWLVVFIAGIPAAGAVSKRLSLDFSLPGQSGYETEQKLIKAYGGPNAEVAYVPVVTVASGQTVAGSTADVKAVFDALRALPSVRVVDYSTSQDKGLITSDGRTTFGLVYAPLPKSFTDVQLKDQVDVAFKSALGAHHLTGSITGYNQLA